MSINHKIFYFTGLISTAIIIIIVAAAFVTKKLDKRQPAIEIKSIVVNSLYRNCVHDMAIEIPELTENYNPTFKCVGGEIILTEKKGTIKIIPNALKTELKIFNDTTYIGSKIFLMRLIPRPSILVKANDQFIDEKIGLKFSETKTLTVKFNADESFKVFLPKDARYKTEEWNCTLIRGRKELMSKNFTEETVEISNMLSSAKEGDRLMIEIIKVSRKNGLDKFEDVNIGTVIKNIALY